jgi:hypothetical protein
MCFKCIQSIQTFHSNFKTQNWGFILKQLAVSDIVNIHLSVLETFNPPIKFARIVASKLGSNSLYLK